jgi:Zn-dependent protease
LGGVPEILFPSRTGTFQAPVSLGLRDGDPQARMDEFVTYIPYILIFILCGSAHEFFHAWSAFRLGDNTSRDLGRLSLNPLVHIDPVGSLLFPLLNIFLGGIVIGWMKPVPVSPMNLRHPKRDMLLVSLAGPYANLLLGFGGFLALVVYDGAGMAPPRALQFWILINLMLAFFNLLPIPPLDGSSIVDFIRGEKGRSYHSQGFLGMTLLYVILLLGGFRYLWIAIDESVVFMRAVPLLPLLVFLILCGLGLTFYVKTSIKTRKLSPKKSKSLESQVTYEIARKVGLKLAEGRMLTQAEQTWYEKIRYDPGDGQPLCSPLSFQPTNDFCRTCPNFLRCASRLVHLLQSGKRPPSGRG